MTPRKVRAQIFDLWSNETRRYEERYFDGILVEIVTEHETYPATEYDTNYTGLRVTHMGVVIEQDADRPKPYHVLPLGQIFDRSGA